MKAVTLKYTVQTVNEWRAGYSESCKSGSGASVRKPTAAMRQGAGYLAYSTPPRLTARRSSMTFSAPGVRSDGSPTSSVSSMGCPLSRTRDATRIRPITSGWATKSRLHTAMCCVLPSTMRSPESQKRLTSCYSLCVKAATA